MCGETSNDSDELRVLANAIHRDDIARVRQLIKPAMAEQRLANGMLLLHFARSPATVELLLDAGTDINARDSMHGATALRWAVPVGNKMAKERPEVARFLTDRGAHVDMFTACTLGDPALVERVLCESEAGICNQRLCDTLRDTPQGRLLYCHYLDSQATPLHVAAQFGHTRIVKLLLKAGADPNIGELFFIPAHKMVGVVKTLLEHGWDVNRMHEGRTLLHVCTADEVVRKVICLLSAEADVNARDALGRTPLHLVAENGKSSKLASILIDAGADINAADAFGRTARGAAEGALKTEVAELLASLNADSGPPRGIAASAVTGPISLHLRLVCMSPPPEILPLSLRYNEFPEMMFEKVISAPFTLDGAAGVRLADGSARFDMEVKVKKNRVTGRPQIESRFAHGSPGKRFLLLRWKTCANKVPVTNISWEQIEAAVTTGGVLQARLIGEGGCGCYSYGGGWTLERS